ncbi:unnamed protein product, partial [Owenia fusiformis]
QISPKFILYLTINTFATVSLTQGQLVSMKNTNEIHKSKCTYETASRFSYKHIFCIMNYTVTLLQMKCMKLMRQFIKLRESQSLAYLYLPKPKWLSCIRLDLNIYI